MKLPLMGGVGPAAETSSHLTPPSSGEFIANLPDFVVSGNKPSLYPHVDRLNQPEKQEGYRFVKEVRGQVGGPSKIWVHNPKLAKAAAPLGAYFHPGHYSLKPAALRRRFLE